MGSTLWNDDDYRQRAAFLRRMGRGAFEYDEELARLPANQRRVHEKMNPFGVRVRESRDSEAHHESHAVAVLFDVTGSMGSVPRIVQRNLCQLMNLLLGKGYLADPQIMVGGIGDATCDRAPLQIGQFESGVEIDQDLAKLWLEGGGGGQKTESYELAMYFMARKTAVDCLEKRGKRGYLFIIGDEMPYRNVSHRQAAGLMGDSPEVNVTTASILRELEQKFDTYFILPNLTSYYNDPEIHRCWTELLGEKVLKLGDPEAISDLIAAVIGLSEGVVDVQGVIANMRQTGRGDWTRVVAEALLTTDSDDRILQPSLAIDSTTKPRWHLGLSYKSRRWEFAMNFLRSLKNL